MGVKDKLAKQYMNDNRRFADAFNYYIYHGEQVLKPENLTEKNITELVIPNDKNYITYPLEKHRDLLKQCIVKQDGDETYIILGIENQSDIHYAMPVRCMLYDAMNYETQIKEKAKINKVGKRLKSGAEYLSGLEAHDKIMPVVTLVIFWGMDEWNGPRKLSDMFPQIDSRYAEYINDYKLHLIVPREIESAEMFATELGNVFSFLRMGNDMKRMKQLVKQKEEYFKQMDIESAQMIETFGRTKIKIEESEEKVDMCKAIDDMIEEGREEGLVEGEYKKLLEQVIKKVQKCKSLEMIADELEEDVADIREIYEIVKKNAPEYDLEKIMEQRKKKN